MKIKLIMLFPVIIIMIFGISSFKSSSPQEEIIGTWISNDDELWKITFTTSGERKDYYENVLMDVYSYYITNHCNSHTRSNNEMFLKTVDNQNDVSCDLLNGIHTNQNGTKTLSITSERGKLYLFTKQ